MFGTFRRYRKGLGSTLAVLLLPALVSLFWHLTTPRPQATWQAGERPHLVAFAPGGKILATVNEKPDRTPGPIRLWNPATGQAPLTLADGWLNVWRVEFSPNGRFLRAQNGLRHVTLWDAATGAEWADFQLPADSGYSTHTCFSPDGRFLIFERRGEGQEEHDTLRFWDLERKEVWAVVEGRLAGLTFAPGGGRFGVYQQTGNKILRVDLWRVNAGANRPTLIKRNTVAVDEVAFSRTLDDFATAVYPQGYEHPAKIKVCDLATGVVRAETTYADPKLHIQGLSFSPDGDFLIAVGGGWRGQRTWRGILWVIHSGLKRTTTYEIDPLFSPDGKRFVLPDATGGDLLDTKTLGRVASLRNKADEDEFAISPVGWQAYARFAFSPDSKYAVVTGLEHFPGVTPFRKWPPGWPEPKLIAANAPVARMWDLATAGEVAELRGCVEVLWSADGKVLAAVYQDGMIRTWDVPPRKPLGFILGLTAALWAIIVGGIWLVRRLAVSRA